MIQFCEGDFVEIIEGEHKGKYAYVADGRESINTARVILIDPTFVSIKHSEINPKPFGFDHITESAERGRLERVRAYWDARRREGA